jgi:hypothetical protein
VQDLDGWRDCNPEEDLEECVKEAVDKKRLPAVVRLSRSFWGDARPVI